MATITQLIDELETIATAQVGLESFIYGDPHEVNSYRDKTYPLLLADRNTLIDSFDLKNRQRVYVFKLHFFHLYDRDEIVQVDPQIRQRDLEVIAEEFLQEFRTRYKAQNHPWKVENDDRLTGNWLYRRHNDRLVQLTYNLKVRSQGECFTGTFNY